MTVDNDEKWKQFTSDKGRCFTQKDDDGNDIADPDGKFCCKIPEGKINIEGELKPGGSSSFDKRPIEDKVNDYCGGVMNGVRGPSEKRERRMDGFLAASCGLANIVGMGALLRKGINVERGGSPNYVDQPTELIKYMKDRLRQTRDRAFYVSMCDEYLADMRLMNASDKLHALINLEITELNNLVQFEVKSLMLVEMFASMCLLSIVTYLLLISPKKKV
jgi:hypothetical protein